MNPEFSNLSKPFPKNFSKMNATLSVALTGVLVLSIIAPYVSGYMIAATVNFFLLLSGFTLRHRNRQAHAALMSLGMLSDLSLVLVLQFQRNAIQTAVSFKLSALNQAHILTSTLASSLYIPMAMIGISLLTQKGGANSLRNKTIHRNLGWAVLTLRTLGFFLMFSMLEHHLSDF